MKRQKSLCKTLSRLMALAMFVTLAAGATVAKATSVRTNDYVFDPSITKGSITVHKYATVNIDPTKPENTPTNTGEGTGYTTTNIDTDVYKPLKNAQFLLYKLPITGNDMEKYYSGEGDEAYSIVGGQLKHGSTDFTPTEAMLVRNELTNGDGIIEFTDLELGIYYLVEVNDNISQPDHITAPISAPCLISVPMVNAEGLNSDGQNGNNKWLYDINVYPKNHKAVGDLELTKVEQKAGQTTPSPLAGVEFKLEKIELEMTTDGLALPDSEWVKVIKKIPNDTQDAEIVVEADEVLVTNGDGKIKVEYLPSGLYGTVYKLTEVSAPVGYIVNPTPIYFKVMPDNTILWCEASGEVGGCNNISKAIVDDTMLDSENSQVNSVTNNPLAKITIQNPIPDIDKTVKLDDSNDYAESAQYSIGDTVEYKITVDLPYNLDEITKFVVTDEWSGLTYVANSFKVLKPDSETETIAGVSATINNEDGQFTFDLSKGTGNNTALYDYRGKTITIKYSAILNKNAEIANKGNLNTAKLEYSSDITTGNNPYIITDEAVVYTYQYDVTKWLDSNGTSGTKIPGVQFELYSDAAGTRVPIEKVGTANGIYRHALTTEQTTDQPNGVTLITGEGGILSLQGLEPGLYYLKEVKTVDGYNLLSGLVKIPVMVTEGTTITKTTENEIPDIAAENQYAEKTRTFTKEGTPADSQWDANNHKQDIINKKGFVLPQTGSMGYLLFCAAGLLLIGGGAALIFSDRKKVIR